MKGMKVNGLYKAQVLKDSVMAASVEPFIDRRTYSAVDIFIPITTSAFPINSRRIIQNSRSQLSPWLHRGEPFHGRPFKSSRFHLG